MITVISPAKTLDLSFRDVESSTQPEFKKEIKELTGILSKKSKSRIQELMGVSEDLAVLNQGRFRDFSDHFTHENARPAIFAFRGDVYRQMEVDAYTSDELAFAQEHLRILSGLYGLLKPLDLIQPYRLEMGIKLKNKKSDNLYGFWNDKITRTLDAVATKGVVINLASREYFKAVDIKKLRARVITVTFKEYREDGYKNIGIFAKQARGMMVNYMIRNRVNEPHHLKLFQEGGYEYSEQFSTEGEWVFIR